MNQSFTSHEKLRSDYFLRDYINKLGNFNQPFVESAFCVEGYYDNYNYDAADLITSASVIAKRRANYNFKKVGGKNIYTYEFVFIPNLGFLGDSLPLLTNCELKLNFDRAQGSAAVMSTTNKAVPFLEIKECHAVTEWVSSSKLKNYFSGIDYNPIVYSYDEIEILNKSLPMNETSFRLDNLRGGNIPTYLFAGIIPKEAITGDLGLSSTNFAENNVTELNISLNGRPVTGYPIRIKDGSETYPLFQFNDTVGRTYNNKCCAGLKKVTFQSNFIWAHRFEAEETSQGWIGIDIKLSKPFTKNYVMIVWLVNKMSVSIDKYHSVERLSL